MADSILNHPQFDATAHSLELDRGLPLGSLKAVALQESNGVSNARSADGGVGLMQFTNPAVIQKYNVDPTNPWDSLRGAADYLGDNMKKYGDFNASLADYNGGPKAAQAVLAGQQHGPATMNYVPQVNAKMANTAPTSDAAFSAVQNQVASLRQQGVADSAIVQTLQKGPVADAIKSAMDGGMSFKDIVTKVGGQPLAAIQAAQDKINNQSFATNAIQGAGNAVSDVGNAAQQIGARVQGNDAQLQSLQKEQAAAEATPERQALDNTAGATVGSIGVKALPSAIAAAATGGSSIPAQIAIQGGVGALQGALTPTTGDGQIASNIGYGAAGGAVGGAVGGMSANAPRILLKSAVGDLDGFAAQKAAAEAAGYKNLGIADISNNAAALKNSIGKVPGSSWLGADKSTVEQQTGALVNGRAGATGNVIGPDAVREAQASTSQLYNDALNGVKVDVSDSFGKPLNDLVANYERTTLPSMRSTLPGKLAGDLQDLAAQGPVDARTLQGIRSQIGAEMSSQATPASTVQALKGIYTHIDEALQSNLPAENLVKFQQANSQYKNLQAMENMVRSSNGTGEVSNRQILSGAKQANKSAFETGDAPYQDIGNALIQGKSSSPLGAVADFLKPGASYGTVMNPLVAAKALLPVGFASNLAMRFLTDPKYATMLASMSAAQRASIQQAANGVGGAVGGAIGQQIAAPTAMTPSPGDLARAMAAKYGQAQQTT